MRLYNVVHILVGTPGRVLDLADKGIANLKECNTLIMDEVRWLSRLGAGLRLMCGCCHYPSPVTSSTRYASS